MSDPVTTAAIEDVLTSVRRLVAEGSQPLPGPPAAPRDRLVLTAALRVDAPQQAARAAPVREELPVFRTRQAAPLRLDRRVPPDARAAPDAPADPAMAGAGRIAADEAVLRQIVAEVIAQELAGALGERITRNLRQLIRSEIARALAERQDR